MKIKVLFTAWLAAGIMTAAAQEAKIDSLKQVFNDKSLNVSKRVSACIDIADYFQGNDLQKSIEYAYQGISMSEKAALDSLKAHLYYQLGVDYYCKPQYDSAEFFYNKASEILSVKKDEKLECSLYKLYGVLYNDKAQNEKAIEYYEKALKLSEKLELKRQTGGIYLNIGIVYMNSGNMKFYEKYCLKARDILSSLPPSSALAAVFNNLGYLYYLQDRRDEAYKNTMDAISLYDSLGMKNGTVDARINLAKLYCSEKKFDNALDVARKCLEDAETIGDFLSLYNSIDVIADIYYDAGNYKQCEYYLHKELEICDTTLRQYALIYQDFIRVYVQLGEKDKAVEALEKYVDLMSKGNYVKVQNTYSELEVKYETEKKELKISALEKERQLMIWLSIAGGAVLLLALAAFFFLWRWTVQKKRLAESQRELAEQGKLLAEQHIKQLEQEQQLIATQAMFDGEVQERIRLARDLHDRLGGILSAIKYNLADMRKVITPEPASLETYNTTMELLDESMREMRRIAHHLMPDALSRFGLKTAVSEFCKSIPHAKFTWYGDDERLDAKLELVVYRIAYELVNNALKHSGASHILVQIVRDPDRVSLTVEDNGCGFAPETGEGMGLSNIRTHVASYNGMMDIGSVAGEGTEINVEFSITN